MGIFKAYDIRGIYVARATGPDELDEELARKIGRATAQFLGAKKMVVSRDMRLSSPSISEATIQGILEAGSDAVDIGLASTPGNYFATANYGFDGGLQITASHNPKEYNGFKVSGHEASPIGEETGLPEIERIATSGKFEPAAKKGSVSKKDIAADYKKHILKFAEDIAPLKLVIDAANGMGGLEIPLIFDQLPCQTIPLYFELDGTFPNHEANPLKYENLRDLRARVKEAKADLGVALDGDCDRCAYIDERGEIISSDLITALIAREVLAKEPGARIIYDVRSSWAVKEEIERSGGIPLKGRVGHAFMKAALREKSAAFAGELSGHYYFRDNFYCDSASIGLIKVLNLLSKAERPISEIIAPLNRYFATGEINFEVEDKAAMIMELTRKFSDGKQDFMDGITVEYEDWWFNVRQSHTEPLLRLNLEGRTRELMEEGKQKLISLLGKPVE
ncbi:MAG: hypothetical protein AMS15_00165 [Planctomycetes bacterium DG_23]|nr:MAG: hypothetical protein AMS15_00165 [Planctomycetes bacterium DG_23]